MEPKSCPRCGKPPEIFDHKYRAEHSWSATHRCAFVKPFAQIEIMYGTPTRDEAVAHWNTFLEAMKK
jgi:hypothetical protein